MTEQVYGLSKSGAARTAETVRRVLGRRPDTGRRTRRIYPPGASGGAPIIAFQIISANCVAKTATAFVVFVPCPNSTGLEVGDEVNLVDVVGCNLTGNESLLGGLKGWATKGTPDAPGTAEEDKVGCEWAILNICCPIESC